MKVSIMITSLNRSDELQRTLPKVEALDPPAAEIWVVADGCTDDTVDYIKRHHPQVKLIEHKQSMGSVPSRVEVMNQVTGELVLALDDDSYPEQRDCLARLSDRFKENKKLAIATFPQRSDEYPVTLTQKNFGETRHVRSFPNSGACLRVSTYRILPGFEPMFFHMYEEPDYALQCAGNGWDIVSFPEITIRHHYSGLTRSEMRNHHRHARNEFWSTIMRCPFPYLIVVLLYRTLSQARYALSRGLSWVAREPVWWWQAITGITDALGRRSALTWSGYKRWLQMSDR
jgi:GT2 family glycosyltransferase